MNSDTIVAIATPPGRGGVGILRLSGTRSLSIAQKITHQNDYMPRKAYYCSFYNPEKILIDQGLGIYFCGPHSFTGEDVIELHGHGSPIVLDELLASCVHWGARLANPGEFSERAFLNDKIDLTQAEAIADLIGASSKTAARMALKSLQGDFSKKINQINQELTHLRMYVEAAIDFPEEEIDFLSDGKIENMLDKVLHSLQVIEKNAIQGTIMREGVAIVIAGRPNAGKSTLINALAQQEVAIVTEIAGTTRDVIKEHILLDDIPVHIIDTAGLRESTDIVEQEGIKRTWREVEKADCILLVHDKSMLDNDKIIEELQSKVSLDIPIIEVFNKIDKLDSAPYIEENQIHLSAKQGLGIDLLKAKIKKTIGFQESEGQFLARRRHLHALREALRLVMEGKDQLLTQRAGELLAEDLRLAHQSLCEITGEFTSDDLLGEIFSSFCIGK
jgi:tRNA modification GTPase